MHKHHSTSAALLAELIVNTPVVVLPPVLQSLPTAMKKQLSITLVNDENSSNEELVEFWTTECAVPLDVAQAAVEFRSYFFKYPFFELFL